MKRIIRFIGNRLLPEKALYASDEEKCAILSAIRDYKKLRPRLKRVPPPPPRFNAVVAPPAKPQPIAEAFETNLMEPLVGWKAWHIRDGRLVSQLRDTPWFPEEPFQATCPSAKCVHSPTTHCSCGVYAKNNFGEVREFLGDGEACGVVLGWGRYVRGTDGWRSEFAYPARILIARDSLRDLDKLKEYRVPLYVMEPMRLYDPAEDGYEYWNNEENWDFRTSAESHAQESASDHEDQDA
jgi:hypothetical protein